MVLSEIQITELPEYAGYVNDITDYRIYKTNSQTIFVNDQTGFVEKIEDESDEDSAIFNQPIEEPDEYMNSFFSKPFKSEGIVNFMSDIIKLTGE